MKTIKNRFFKILAVVLAAFGITATFTACYGVVGNDYISVDDPAFCHYELSFVVKGDINQDGIVDETEVIPDISVTGFGANEVYKKTDENGFATLIGYTNNKGGVLIEFDDIDEDKNGSFNWNSVYIYKEDSEKPYSDPVSSTDSPDYMKYEEGKIYEITLTPKTESDEENVPDESDETSEETTDETTENTDDSENQ